MKASTIIKCPNYETLTIDEIFSKFKSIETNHQIRTKIENPTVATMDLVSSTGGSLANPLKGKWSLPFSLIDFGT